MAHASVKVDSHNVISSAEAANIIQTAAQTVIACPEMVDQIPAIILRGAPGVGKSSIVRQAAENLGIGFIDVRLAQLERCDFCGLPSVENGVTNWNVPSFWPRDKKSAGILFFDEITSAASDIQVAAYSMILDRKIPNTDYELPKKWIIVAAGNRSVDRAVVKTMSSALANRFMHFELEANCEEWCDWAVTNDIHPAITGYINYRPQNLFKMEGQNLEMGWPSPRSWEKVSSMINLFKDNEEVLRKVVYGLIGNGVGVEFVEFYKINAQFDDVLKMMTDAKAKVVIPEKADRKYALCSAVAYLLWNGKNDKDTEARISGFYRIVNKLTPDFAVLLSKLCLQGNSKVTKMEAVMKIMKHKDYKKFAEKYGAALSKKYSL